MVIVNDTNFSGMTGGALTAALIVVGSNGTGSFQQSGGTSVLWSLCASMQCQRQRDGFA